MNDDFFKPEGINISISPPYELGVACVCKIPIKKSCICHAKINVIGGFLKSISS